MFISYDPAQGFPQAAQFGRGTLTRTTTRDEEGQIVETVSHTPPDGLASFQVEDAELVHGTDERLYRVIDGPALEPKTQAEREDIVVPARRARLDAHARRIARDKRRAVLNASDDVDDDVLQSEFLSLQGRAAAMMRRESAGRGKPGESDALDQLEAQADALGGIDAALEAIRAKISDGTYVTEAEIDSASEWP